MPILSYSTDTSLEQAIEPVKEYGIFTLDTAGIVLMWNEGASVVQGYSAEETLGQPFAALYEKEVNKPHGYFNEVLDKAREQGYFEEEGWRQHKDGAYYWSTILITPIYDAHNVLLSYTVISRDLTDRKLAAELSEISEANHNTLVLATSNITWIRTREGQFTAPHLQWEHFTGQVWPEYQGFGWLAMHPAEEREKVNAFWQRLQSLDLNVLRGNWQALQQPAISNALTLKTRLWSKIHQEYRYVITALVPRFGETDIIGWLGNEKDVHKAATLKLQLKEAAELQNLMINSARIGLWRWDLTTNAFILDKNVAHYFGLKPKSSYYAFDEVMACVHPEDKPTLHNLLQHCIETGELYNVEFRVVWPDGTLHHLAGRGQVNYDAQKKPMQLLGSYWDISETKQLFEEQTRAQVAELQRKQQVEFVDTICHEMRNPLNGIMGYLSELREFVNGLTSEQLQQLTPEALAAKRQQLQECLDAIAECTQYQEKVIDSVIEISDIEADKLTLVKKAFSLEKVMRSLVEKQKLTVKEKALTLNCEVPETDTWVDQDKSCFKKILRHILAQAVESTSPNGIINIKLNLLKEDNNDVHFEIFIQDTGRGFTPEEKANLFERYMPVTHHQAAHYDELAIGLAVSKRLTQRLDGTFNVESEIDKGTLFHLTFRWERGLQPTIETSSTPVALPAPQKRIGNKVLVVDDNSTNQKVLKRLLEKKGYQCQLASDGQEAIDHFKDFQPDLIFMDLQMPIKNGFEATQAIRELETQQQLSPVPICAITAYGREEYQARAEAVGMNDFIVKPFKPKQIESLLAQYFVTYEQREEAQSTLGLGMG